MEIGYSAAFLYNSYLATGDTSFISRPALVYAAKQPDMNFWKALYDYNSRREHKINIHGMDFERAEFLKVLKILRPADKARPAAIARMLQYIDTVKVDKIGWLKSTGRQQQDSIYTVVNNAITANMPLYEAYYEADFKLVKDIMTNGAYANAGNRNKNMALNVERQVAEENIKKFMVISGEAHGNMADPNSLCSLLCRDKSHKNRLLSIAMVCKNCYDWQQPDLGQAAWRAPFTYYKDDRLLDDIYKTYFTAGIRYCLVPSKDIADLKVRKYSDFIILMKDQPEF